MRTSRYVSSRTKSYFFVNIFFVLLVNALLFASGVHASAEDDYARETKVEVSGNIDLTGVEGEIINKRHFSFYWETRDLSVQGAGGFNIDVYRSYAKTPNAKMLALENWELELPRISLSSKGYTKGEVSGDGLCVDPESDPKLYANQSPYWTGLKLIIPGYAVQELLFKDASAHQFPSDVKYVTKDNWIARCISTSNTGGKKDGFELISPEGIKYTIDILSRLPTLLGVGHRDHTIIYASRKEDPRGNYLTYNYSIYELAHDQWGMKNDCGQSQPCKDLRNQNLAKFKLTRPYIESIDNSGGSSVDFTWENKAYGKRLSKIAANGQEWNYHYNEVTSEPFNVSRELRKVTLPDQAEWEFEYKPITGDEYAGIYGDYNDSTVAPDFYANFGNTLLAYAKTTYHQISKVTTPEKLNIEYSYSDCRYSHITLPNGMTGAEVLCPAAGIKYMQGMLSSLRSRKVTGNNLDEIEWALKGGGFDEENNLIFIGYDLPDKKVRYTFYRWDFYENNTDFADRWKHDLMLGYSVYPKDSDFVENEAIYKVEYEWEKLSKIGENRLYYKQDKDERDGNYYQIVKTKATITVDGKQHVTEYLDRDSYGNPQTIMEQGTHSLTKRYVYSNSTASWILGLLRSEEIEGEGKKTRDYYNNGLIKEVDDYGIIEEYEYHGTGDLYKKTTKRLPGQDISVLYTDYHRGVARKEEHPENITITRVVNDTGTIKSEKNGRGYSTSYTYDAMNRIKTETQPGSVSSDFTYDVANNKKTTEHHKYKNVEKYDSFSRSILSEEHDLKTGEKIYVDTDYWPSGKPSFVSHPSSSSTSDRGIKYWYDELGRLTKIIDTETNDEIKYCYGVSCNNDRPGRPAVTAGYVVTDARGFEIVYNFRTYGSPGSKNLEKIHRQVSLSPIRYITTTIDTNRRGQIKSVTQGGVTREYKYNDQKLLWKQIHPEVGTTEYKYDLSGNQIELIHSGLTTYFSYDDLNRLTNINYPADTEDVAYEYDKASNIELLQSGVTTWKYRYNEADMLNREELVINRRTFRIDYIEEMVGWKLTGNLDRILYPSGYDLDVEVDGLGRTIKLGSLVDYVEYYPDDKVVSVNYGNGSIDSMFVYSNGLPKSLTTSDKFDVNIFDIEYTYDENKNVSFIHDGLNGLNDRDLDYDGLNRLVVANSRWGNGSYAYDDVGNIKVMNLGSHSKVYEYGSSSNLLNSVAGIFEYEYDDNGNIRYNGSDYFHFDYANRLTRVSSVPDSMLVPIMMDDITFFIPASGANDVSYQYDGNGHRTVTTGNSGERYSIYSKSGKLMHTYKAVSGEFSNYVYLGDRLVARIDDCGATDSDGDGLFDCVENQLGLDPSDQNDAASDLDGDGVSNMREYQLGINIKETDTDGDGIDDGYEVRYGLNVLINDAFQDYDGDGLTNSEEYDLNTNPYEADSDNDGIPDNEDELPMFNPALIPILNYLIFN